MALLSLNQWAPGSSPGEAPGVAAVGLEQSIAARLGWTKRRDAASIDEILDREVLAVVCRSGNPASWKNDVFSETLTDIEKKDGEILHIIPRSSSVESPDPDGQCEHRADVSAVA
ncbi:hypothetical protein QMZ05_02310 [Bradyrhizobium sp. INPA03-11B]|uniref:hypothetical protein n=1 Tax=Bradyrhizobium sp. INPA03-11B TaxID=418598 RepID=UPI00338E50E4